MIVIEKTIKKSLNKLEKNNKLINKKKNKKNTDISRIEKKNLIKKHEIKIFITFFLILRTEGNYSLFYLYK